MNQNLIHEDYEETEFCECMLPLSLEPSADRERVGSIDRIALAQDRGQWRALVNAVMNFHVPYNAVKFLSGCTTGVFSRIQLHIVAHFIKKNLVISSGNKPLVKGFLKMELTHSSGTSFVFQWSTSLYGGHAVA
jgi:hypothetical protein